jgi:hypothetical protein
LHQLGQQVAERTADRIVAEVKRYLSEFPSRTKRSARSDKEQRPS